MAIDTSAPRSRRALLGAALGAGIATIASALGRPLPARATDGQAVLVGGEYTATSVTRFENSANDDPVLKSVSDSGRSVVGESNSGTGVEGTSTSGTGVYGGSNEGTGVHGWSETNTAVLGESISGTGGSFEGGGFGVFSSGRVGVIAWSSADLPASKAGVMGLSTVLPENATLPIKTGVYGYAPADSSCRGVHGQAVAGRGVYGQATTGYGVRGQATTGAAGYFATTDPTKGYALRAVGRVKLDKCAGVATIASGASSVLVTPGIDLTSSSAVVATLQGNAGAVTTTVSRCFINATANTFTIYLTTKATQSVKVAWHVFG